MGLAGLCVCVHMQIKYPKEGRTFLIKKKFLDFERGVLILLDFKNNTTNRFSNQRKERCCVG